jgi:hypothetical protein
MNMSVIYRKSLKGIDEVAFKSTGLPMRLSSYLLAVDGQASVDQLVARNAQLPSMATVLQGLLEQGFLEVAGNAANVVNLAPMRVGNGASVMSAAPMGSAYAPSPPPEQAYAPPPPPAPPQGYFPELEAYKGNMVRDVSTLLGADAAPVINKIQACRTKDDLFATMMGVKKIISIYADRNAAEKFAGRYNALST